MTQGVARASLNPVLGCVNPLGSRMVAESDLDAYTGKMPVLLSALPKMPA